MPSLIRGRLSAVRHADDMVVQQPYDPDLCVLHADGPNKREAEVQTDASQEVEPTADRQGLELHTRETQQKKTEEPAKEDQLF